MKGIVLTIYKMWILFIADEEALNHQTMSSGERRDFQLKKKKEMSVYLFYVLISSLILSFIHSSTLY